MFSVRCVAFFQSPLVFIYWPSGFGLKVHASAKRNILSKPKTYVKIWGGVNLTTNVPLSYT